MSEKKNILFITGTRADFGKLKSLIRKVEADSAFNCKVFATGMHMLKKYGSTIDEIRKENINNIFPFLNQTTDTSQLMDIVLADTIRGLSNFVRENEVDLIVVHGDRVESLAGAIVGALQGVRTAHIEGGERSGTVDELLRHAISKLSHIHFVSTEENKNRLLQMGENESNVFVIGSPDIDIMLNTNLPSLDKVRAHYDIPFDDYLIFIYHPVVTEIEEMGEKITEVLEGIKKSGRNFVVIYPNNDPGSDIIISKISKLRNLPNFRIFPSIRFENFLVLIKHARAVVGNSSCGIHEAPIYGVPTINIGSRQQDRFKAPSIFNIPEDREIIGKTLSELPDRYPPLYTYGNGRSAELFSEILNKGQIWDLPLQKNFCDR